MIYKITYQKDSAQVPLRENTQSLYIEAPSKVEARAWFHENTDYNLEFIQEVTPAHLEYEKENNPDFKLVEC